jgi:hypothetical protein
LPFNPNDSRSLDRLSGAIRWSRRQMASFRRHRYAVIEQYVGHHYSDGGAPAPVVVNLIYLAANIYLRQLVSKAPRAMVTARNPQFQALALDMQAWLDRAAAGLKLLESLRTCAQNALFGGLGIMKIGVARAGEIDIRGTLQQLGQPFALPVSFDNFVVDMNASRYEYAKYAGDRYPVSLEEAKEDPLFDKQAREALTAQPNRRYNEMGDTRTEAISHDTDQPDDSDYEDVVELWDIWLPKEKLLVTVPYQEGVDGGIISGQKPLRVIDWDEPHTGPYRVLSLCDVPDQMLSAAPLQSLMDMHEMLNGTWRKIGRQVDRSKKISTYKGGAAEDQANINRAEDGEAVQVNFPDQLQEAVLGGADPALLQFVEQVRNVASWLGGNLDTLGGLSPQAQTLGQEELLSKSSSAQIAEMQDRCVVFMRDTMSDQSRHWYRDPHLFYEAARKDAAGGDVPVSITPQMRQIPFDRLDISIDPYSAQAETPATRLSGFLQMLQQVIMPMMPIIQQQGGKLQYTKVLEVCGRYGNYPDLPGLIEQGPPPDQAAGQALAQGATEQAQKIPQPNRTTTRINRPGMTDRGHNMQMQQLLAGQRGPNGQNGNGQGR